VGHGTCRQQASSDFADRWPRFGGARRLRRLRGRALDGILSIEFDGAKYVISSHRAAKLIWMLGREAALRPAGWLPPGDELFATISRVLSKKTGAPVAVQI
jgi:hypothetical protein